MLCLRFISVPVVAQGLPFMTSSGSTCFSGSTTGSIIWPIVPSAKITAGMRYFSPSSNASDVMSAISCTVAGARTITRKSP